MWLLRTVIDAASDESDSGEDEGGLGDLFQLADAVAAVVDAPVTIEDANSRVLAYSARQELTDPARVGGVTGLVGAAGGLGGFVPPLIMGYVYGRTDSYAIGLALLSVTAALTLVLTLTVVRRTAATRGTTA